MKAITICLLAMMVVAATAARRLPLELTAANVQHEIEQKIKNFRPLPMPAIYIPEFGKEIAFPDMPAMPNIANLKPIAPSDLHWNKRSKTNAPNAPVPDTDSQQGAMQTTNVDQSVTHTNNQHGNTQPVSAQQADTTPAAYTPTVDTTQDSTPKQQDQQLPATATPAAGSQDDCSKTDTSAQAVLRCVNAVRTNPQAFKADYPCSTPWLSTISRTQRNELHENGKLDSSAQRQANDMARNSRINHVGSDGSSVADRIKDAGYTTFPQGENIAMGQTSAHQVTMEWMCSEGHRHAIMSCEYDDVGTAVAENSGTWYYAQNFGCSSGHCPMCEVA